MSFEYAAQVDILRHVFKDVSLDVSDDMQPSITVDYDAAGNGRAHRLA